MNERLTIIWVSLHPPFSQANSAGWQTFNYYYKQFNTDARFDVKLVALCNKKDQEKVEKENTENDYKFIYRDDPAVNKLSKISNIESSYNPFNRYANLMSNYLSMQILQALREYRDEGIDPDIIILEWTHMVVLAKDVKKVFPDAKVVASEHDVTFVGYNRKRDYYKCFKKIVWKQKVWWEKRVEVKALRECDLILPHNPNDIELLETENISRDNMMWLTPYFSSYGDCGRQAIRNDVLFFGAMSRPENYLSAIWYIEKVIPLLEDSGTRFVILGSNPPEELKKYEGDSVHITGFVDSVVPYFESSLCLVAPLVLGAGIKVKILEGLSSGIPVITNNIGIEGIPAKPGYEYIHAENEEQYADAIRKAKVGGLEEIGQRGKQFIKQQYDLKKSFQLYRSRLIEVVNRQSAKELERLER